MARPKKEIGKEDFEKLCVLQCTMKEICYFFEISDKTLTRWCQDEYGMSFSDVFEQKRVRGLIALRRTQFQMAERSAAMAIFLGKNYLGQTDRTETEATVNVASLPSVKIYLPDNGRDDASGNEA